MIYVTQGHEKGVGVEIFLKAFLCLDNDFQSKFTLICSKFVLKENFDCLRIKYTIENNVVHYSNSKLNCIWISDNKKYLSTEALEIGIKISSKTDYLLTLPTSKDQLILNGTHVNGHTEFFRKFYKLEEISMTFLSHNSSFLLLTDHIAIDEVTDKIKDTSYCLKKITNCIDGLPEDRKVQEIFIAGINPHAGESGLISKNDSYIDNIVSKLKESYSITIHEKVAGDTIQFKINNKNQLFIFPFHDQGLGIFKSIYGLYGINFSLGMPIRRVSVDHGTAFNLYGSNKANYNSMLFLLRELQKWI